MVATEAREWWWWWWWWRGYLVVAVAPLGGEHDAGRAVPGVAGVVRLVSAGSRAAAGRGAGGRAAAAAHGRQQHLRAARAAQLRET